MQEHLLFLTGKLAKHSLEKVLAEMKPEFDYTVHELGLTVAALMNTKLIMRRLTDTFGADRVILPGRFRGDLDALTEHFKIPFERGPEELKDLPSFFGKEKKKTPLDRYDIRIFGEIVEAPDLQPEAILARAEAYRKDGADVIDLGFFPDSVFPQLADSIALLKENGFEVSADTHDPQALLKAARWGADYLMSLTEATLHLSDEVDAVPILVPTTPGDMKSLYRCIDRLLEKNRAFIVDPVMDPIHCGFTESIIRYHQLRRDYPNVEILMGIGNLTELTHADTSGINAILLGIASELGVHNVLTTQVSKHCRSVIREADLARRILFAAREEKTMPANIDEGLMMLHERKPFPYDDKEITEWTRQIKDPGVRIQVTESGIHAYNRDFHKLATDPFDFYNDLNVADDGGHAFYLGVELGRAQIAWQLGKRYNQDEELLWGCVVEREQDDLTRFKESGPTIKKKHRSKTDKS